MGVPKELRALPEDAARFVRFPALVGLALRGKEPREFL
jgi:hypothetical protein